MNNNFTLILFFIIIIFIVVIVQKQCIYSHQLNGIWISTEEFNTQAVISNMIITIDGSTFSKTFFISMFDTNKVPIFSKEYKISLFPSFDKDIFSANKTTMLVNGNIDIFKDSKRKKSSTLHLTITSSGFLELSSSSKSFFRGIKV